MSEIKSGKQILDDFFNELSNLKSVNPELIKTLSDLYQNNKFTDAQVKQALQSLRSKNESKN